MPPPYGGIANWSRIVTSELRRIGVLFEVVDTAPRRRSVDGRSAYERFVVSGVDMFRIVRDVVRAIESGCDVLHVTTSGQFAVIRDVVLLSLARLLHVPTVYHIRFGRAPEIREQNTLEWRWLRRAASLAARTIAIDIPTEMAFAEELGRTKVRSIPNPVDHSGLPPVQTQHEKTVIYLGWVTKSKGIEELLTAWHGFMNERDGWRLKLIGPVSDAYGLHLAESYPLEGVEFCGELSHEAAMVVLASGGVFVLPSHTEGFPNVLLEAMALGLPCIATTVGAIPEMLADGGGLTIRPHSAQKLLEALLELTADAALRARMGQQARGKVSRDYSLNSVLAQYRSVWREVTK